MVKCRPATWLLAGGLACAIFAPKALGLCQENFDPETSKSPGRGWSGGWSTDAYLGEVADLTVLPESLPVPEGLRPGASGGRLADFTGVVFRGLGDGQVLDLSESSSRWYLRVAVRRTVADDSGGSLGLSLLFHDKLDRVLTVGCSSSGKLTIRGTEEASTPKPASAVDHAYVWLIKIDKADAQGRRVVCIRSFHESESVTGREPDRWTLVSEPMRLEGVIDRIGIGAGKNVRAELDELRIAGSLSELLGR